MNYQIRYDLIVIEDVSNTRCRVPSRAQSWNLGLEEVDTQRGNGRKWESKRGRERERERVFKSVAFVSKMI